MLALDVIYSHGGPTRVNGSQAGHTVLLDSGTSDGLGLAPAIEFSWTPDLGMLLGTRVILAGHNTPAWVTPAIAINAFL